MTALAREMGGVRQEASSIRHMVIKSPRGSTTEMLILAPIATTFGVGRGLGWRGRFSGGGLFR
jgi:hypothetical protein